ncbi:MAG TPA: GtrA family protein [Candidatus Paceibacterota bacterium]|jgi:putative flippase GtrA|nr:GtrA family protein [Candidatus Paceibacterota bacterium]
MNSNKESAKDFGIVTIIGALVGLLIQPVLANTSLESRLTWGIRIAIFLALAVLAPLALLVARWLDKFWKGVYQFAQFAAVGTLNSFIDVGVLNLETFLYGSSPLSNGLFAAFKAVSFLCSTTNSFFWNKHWTFAEAKKTKTAKTLEFYGIALIGWGLNVGAATLVKAFGPTGSESLTKLWINIVSPVAGIAVSFAWNFIGYKYFVFKVPAPAAATAPGPGETSGGNALKDR